MNDQYGLAYTRVSLDFETQANRVVINDPKIRSYCEFKRITIVPPLYQENVSGTIPLERRPEGAALLEALDEGVEWQGRIIRPDHLIFGAVDRIGRRAAPMMTLVEGLLARGLRVHIAEAGIGCIDLNEPAGWQLFQMLCVFAESEQRSLSKRTRDSLAVRRKAGYCVGQVPYGFLAVPTGIVRALRGGVERAEHRLVEHPEEHPRLLAMLEKRHVQGWGWKKIAAWLRATGVPHRHPAGTVVTAGLHRFLSEGRWEVEHVRQIVNNGYSRALARSLGYLPEPQNNAESFEECTTVVSSTVGYLPKPHNIA